MMQGGSMAAASQMGGANARGQSSRRRGRRGERRGAWALALGAVAVAVGALAASAEAETASCDGQAKGVSCLRKPEKCLTWRKAQFIESFPAFDDSYFIRKLYKCNRDPRKSRCCWADAGMNYIGVDESAAESTVSSEDAEALPGITCENPQRLANGSWTDLKLNVVGDFEEVDLYEGNYSFPIYGDADPPAACTFLISNIRYQLDDEQGSSTLPSMGVVDLSSPRKGRCNRYPNKDTCACNTDDGSCPGVCLQLKRHFECQHCTRQECAAFCDGDFSCAAMEYQNSTEMCWMLYRPGYIQNVDLTDLGAGVSENVPSFTYAQPLSVPPPIESGSARSGIDCYGRSPDAALDTKSVEVVDDDGNGGRCAISDASQRVQRCGSYFPHMGQCGPAECASLCRQDPLCRAHEYNENFKRGQCFSIFEEPSGVVEGTTGTYRCFAVDRSVDTYDSDWFHDYRNHGFRDLSTEPGGVPIDLYDIVGGNPGATTQLASRPTASPTESPTAKKAGRGPCSLNSKRGRCCHAISSSRRRCCKGKIETTEGRQCCTIVSHPNYDKIAKCCSKYTINGETYRDCVSNPSTSSGEYAAIIRTFT